MHRALVKLVALAKREGVALRQSYLRVAKRAAIMVGRYTHAHQFKRARRALKFLRIRLGRVIRDIYRKTAGDEALEARFAPLLSLAIRVRDQDQRRRGRKVYALHAPAVERSEEHTSELQSLMRISYAVFCLKKNNLLH